MMKGSRGHVRDRSQEEQVHSDYADGEVLKSFAEMAL